LVVIWPSEQPKQYPDRRNYEANLDVTASIHLILQSAYNAQTKLRALTPYPQASRQLQSVMWLITAVPTLHVPESKNGLNTCG